jgi:hypothetical protein
MTSRPTDRVDPTPFAPSEDELDRIWARVARSTSSAPARAPRVRRRLRIAVAVPIAAALIAAVALAPNWFGEHGSSVGQPASAMAALQTAGEAAAAADRAWRPLTDGGYHHVFSVPFRPHIKRVFDTGKEPDMGGGFGPTANETWIDANGHGLRLELRGGSGNPDIYPWLEKPDKHGERRGYGYVGKAALTPTSNPDAALRHADVINTWRWRPGNDQPTDELWIRTPKGYVLGYREATGTMYVKGASDAERAQVRYWGDTLTRLSALDGLKGAAADAAILKLLDGDPVDNSMNEAFPTIGQMGITKESRAEERRVTRAVELLGTAPHAPEARRALFQWIAGRPNAHLDGSVRDGLGRRGTRVTFETRYDEPVPARTMTIDDLVAQDRSIHTVVKGPIPDIGPWKVPAYREQRRWYLTVTFDEQSGDLLEYATRVETNTTAKLPWLAGTMSGPLNHLKPTWDVTWNELRSGYESGTRYLARERTTTIKPLAEVCGDDPRICAP